jgi:hypothetical protein
VKDGELALLRTEISRLTRMLEQALELSAGGSAFAFPEPANEVSRPDLLRQPKSGIGGRALLLAAQSDCRELALREKLVPRDFCDGAAWNLLLYLLICRLEERSISISDATSAARVAPTTALRHLALLVDEGLCHRDPDSADARRCWIALTDKGYLMLSRYYEARRVSRWQRGAQA